MSSDNGYLVRQLKSGFWVVDHYFLSNEEWPPLKEDREEKFMFPQQAEAFYADAAKETEYGFHLVPYEGGGEEGKKEDVALTPEEEVQVFADKIPVGFSERTLHKVYSAFIENGIPVQKITDTINSMQNKGILFRERV